MDVFVSQPIYPQLVVWIGLGVGNLPHVSKELGGLNSQSSSQNGNEGLPASKRGVPTAKGQSSAFVGIVFRFF